MIYVCIADTCVLSSQTSYYSYDKYNTQTRSTFKNIAFEIKNKAIKSNTRPKYRRYIYISKISNYKFVFSNSLAITNIIK